MSTHSGTAHVFVHEQRRPRQAMTLALIALIGVVLHVPAAAQNGTPTAVPATPTPAGPADEFGRGTPRGAVRGFLEACWAVDYQRAAQYLDLRRLAPATRQAEGPKLANELCTVIDRTVWIDPEQLSDTPAGDRDDGLPARRDLAATIQTATAPVQILVDRVPRDDGTLIWKVAGETVAKTPELYEEFSYGRLGELLPAPFVEVRFLQVQLWQWLAILVLIVCAALIAWLVAATIVLIGRAVVARSHSKLDDKMLMASVGPLRFTVGVLAFYCGTTVLALSKRADAFVSEGVKVVIFAGVTWLLMRLVDVLAQLIEGRLGARRHVAMSFVPLGRRSVKVFLVFVAFIATLQDIGFNVTSLLAGLGLGGLAVALAAQKTVEHLFGSVTLVADQPVRVGDYVRFGDKTGKVEDIGLRSTRVRSLDRTLISVPNAEFASMQLENLSRRDRFCLEATIGLPNDTSTDQLRSVLDELRKTLLGHPKVERRRGRIRFIGFGAASFRIEIYAFFLTADLDEFLSIREEIFLQVIDIVHGRGLRFVAP